MTMSLRHYSSVVSLLLLLAAPTTHSLIHDKCPLQVPSSIRPNNKIIIAHRGASFHLPEHTLAAYRLGLELGADYIEPDLVATKDGVLIAMHSVDLNITTDVATKFPSSRATFSTFRNTSGYWSYNFDLSEIKQLRVKQRLPASRSMVYDGMFEIPTLQEILDLLYTWNTRLLPDFYNTSAILTLSQSNILPRAGLYAELKEPEWIQTDSNLNLVDLFLEELAASPSANAFWNDTECDALKFDQYLVPPLVVQCFTTEILQQLHQKWTHVYNNPLPPPLVRLVHREECDTSSEEELDQFWYQMGEARAFISGLGVDKACLFPKSRGEEFKRMSIEHELVVHAWTERPEVNEFIVKDNMTSMDDELRYLFCDVRVDGIFSEHVTAALVAARESCNEEGDSTHHPENERTPTAPPTDAQQECDNSSSSQEQHSHTDDELVIFGIAAGVMGLFVGSLVTFWLSNSSFCHKRGRGRRQLEIPQHDPSDVEMI